MLDAYLLPLLTACLVKAEHILGDGPWTPTNALQALLIDNGPELRSLLSRLPDGMLKAIGSTSADAINDFLARHGLAIRLPPFGADEFGTAAVLNMLARWRVPGTRAMIDVETARRGRFVSYPAVALAGENVDVEETASGARVYLPKTDGLTIAIVPAVSLADGLDVLQGPRRAGPPIAGLTFPMIDADDVVDVSWLIGLRHGHSHLSDAVAQVKIRVNHLGAHAKAGAAVRISRSAGGPEQVTINSPFVLAVLVDGEVAFAAHLPETTWKEPPDLGERGATTW